MVDRAVAWFFVDIFCKMLVFWKKPLLRRGEAYGLRCRTPSLGMHNALHLLQTIENVFPMEIQVVETQQQCNI